MIDRSSPFGQATSLRQMMNQMLEDAFVLPRNGGTSWGGPAMDVYEQGDNLVVEASLPGLKPDDLEVNVERGVLTISGRTAAEQEQQERHYLLRERRAGQFARSLQLPPMYQTEHCQATFEQGVLRLVFPKAEEARPRRIQIGSSGQQAQYPGGVARKPEDRA